MLKRAWILVHRDRSVFERTKTDEFPPDRLVHRLRALCFGGDSRTTVARTFAQVYGRADIVLAAEWDTTDPGKSGSAVDQLAPVSDLVDLLDHPEKVGSEYHAGVSTTETLLRVSTGRRSGEGEAKRDDPPAAQPITYWDKQSDERQLKTEWGSPETEPMSAFVGIRTKSGQHSNTVIGLNQRLQANGLTNAVADTVLGRYDLFVGITVEDKAERERVHDFLRDLRSLKGIRKTETLLSQRFVFPTW